MNLDTNLPKGAAMFERFTDRSRRVVVLAQEEARALNHSYIGTEHLLLGLIAQDTGMAARSLAYHSVSLESAREQVRDIVGVGQQVPRGHVPFTPRAKKVLDLSLREAFALNCEFIGTEHLLLGIIKEAEVNNGGGIAALVLTKLSVDFGALRQTTLHISNLYEGGVANDGEERVVRFRLLMLLPREVELLAKTVEGSTEHSLVLARILERRARQYRKRAASQ